MGTYTKNLKLETPNYTDNADIPALAKKNNEIIDSEMIKRANGLDYNEQTGVLQLTGNNSKVGSPIQIKNNLPVTSMASGTELKVNNYKQLIKFTKEGKTEQKSYTGKNILDYITKLNSSGNGLTNVINDDGSITTSGKPSVNYSQVTQKKEIIDELEDGQTYTISQAVANRVLYLEVAIKSKDGTYTYLSCNLPERKSVTFTVDKNVYVSYIITIQTTTTATFGDSSLTITNKYMLCKGTDTADTSFEPYVGGQVSPNPDYPQEIENVRGVENLLKLPDGTYESNGIKAVIKDGVITLNGTATATDFLKIPIGNLKSGTYSMSANNDQTVGSINGSGQFASYRINNNTDNKTIQECILGKKNATAKFTILDDPKIAFIIRTNVGLTYNNFVIKPQLEEGPIAHNFVPNGSNYLQLKNTTDNESKIINIDLKGNNLCSNKEQTLKDELMIENGRAKIIKKYDEYVFTGNETFTFVDNKQRINTDSKKITQLASVYIPNTNTNTNITPLFCAHYLGGTQVGTIAGSNIVSFSEWSGIKSLYFPADYSTIDEFKTKLKSLYDSGNPVKVQYQLAEPKVIDLGEVDLDLLENSTLTCEEESDMQIDYLTISSNIFVQDSLDGNSNQKAPSIDAIKKYFGKKVYDKDANGWIKIEFFDHIEYVYTVVVNKTFNSGWGYTDNVPFPVGVSSLGDRILTSSVICTDAAIKLNAGQYHNGKQGIGINYTNSYETALTKECIYDFRILEYK